jgi:octopine/nopaline transport system permease protein
VIYLFFFGGSGAIMYVASIFGYNDYIEINAFITGSFSIGIISGAYSTEVFRGAIQSIDKGQFEAAKVLGVSKFTQFYKIILPQMLRLAIPNLSNVWQITLKDTSLISVTGLVEIMRQSYVAAGSTRDPLFFYSCAAVLYLMLTYLSMKFINKLELKYSRGY